MPSHYISQENDPGFALYNLEQAIKELRKFTTVRFYGDSVKLAAAAIEVASLSRDISKLANEVIALHEARGLQAAE